MRKHAWIMAAVCLAASTGLAQPAAQTRLEQVLPPETLMFVSLTDVMGSAERFKGTALYQLWREPEVQEFVAPLVAKIEDEIDKARAQAQQAGPLGAAALELLNLKPGQIAIALLPPDASTPLPIPVAAAVIEVHEGVEYINAVIQTAMPLLLQQQGLAEGAPFTHQGVEVKVITASMVGLSIYYAVDGNRILVTTSKALMTDLMDGFRTAPAASLATGPALSQLYKVVGKSPEFIVMVGLAGVLKTYEPMLMASVPPQTPQIIDALGLRDIQSIALATAFDGKAIRDAFCVGAPGERRGIAALLDMPMGEKELLGRVPADALYVSAAKIELSEMYDTLLAMVQQIDPRVHEEFMGQIAQFEAQIGASIKGDILDSIGDELAIYYRFPTELALMFKVERPEPLSALLIKGLAAARPPRWRRGQTEPLAIVFNGSTIHYAPVRVEDVVLWPSFAMKDGVCVVALNPQTIKSVLAREQTESIAGNPKFKQAMAKVARPNVSVEFTDMERLIEPAYDVLALVLQFMSNERDLRELQRELGLDFGKLPSKEAIARHMFPLVQSYSVDAEGFVVQTHGPVGGQLLSFGGGLFGSLLGGARTTSRARVAARGAGSVQNLKNLGLAVAMYAADHNDEFPARGRFAQALMPYVEQDKDVFYHPRNRRKPRGQFPNNIDYQFSSKLPDTLGQVQNPSQTPLAWEKQSFRGGLRAVLFCDGHVESLRGPRLRELGIAGGARR